MKVIEPEPFKSTVEDPEQPFWQNFGFELCKIVGIDPKQQPVADIEFKLRPGRMPRIVVTIEPYSHREIKPIVELFQAVEWKNTRN